MFPDPLKAYLWVPCVIKVPRLRSPIFLKVREDPGDTTEQTLKNKEPNLSIHREAREHKVDVPALRADVVDAIHIELHARWF